MKKYDKLIFVDKSDTSVAPMAEAVMQDLLLLDDILVESRGLVVLFPEPVLPRVLEVFARHDLSPADQTSMQFKEEDFDERTLVLTMEQSQTDKLLEAYPNAVNLSTLGAFVGAPQDVAEPYGGLEDEYEQCYDRLRGLLLTLAEIIKEEDV